MNIRQHFGLSSPREPARLMAAAVGTILAVILGCLATWLALSGELIAGSPREHYLLYLAGLIVAGLAAAAWPRVAAVLLSLASVDMALGFGSFAMVRLGLADTDVLPDKYRDPPRFEWHPLLQGVPIPSIQRKVVALTISHSTQGTRGRDYVPEELKGKSVIAVFGGSTTYDLMVSDGETWPAQLEAQLGATSFAVINHGVPGYSTAEHVVQTAFYEKKFGTYPRCAIYYVGWNDLRSARNQPQDWGFARNHLPSQIDNLEVRRIGSKFRMISPAATIAGRLVANWTDTTIRRGNRPLGTEIGSKDTFDDVVRQNVRTISAINRARGVRTLWVTQVLNLASFVGDSRDSWIASAARREVPGMLAAYDRLLRSEAAALGDTFLALDPGAFEPSDYQDSGHFSVAGSAKLARLLARPVALECR